MPITDFEVEPLLKEFGENLIADIKYEMQNQGLGGSNLEKSLDYQIKDNTITVTAAPYLKWAQIGRDKGKVPYEFEKILETWIVANGIRPHHGTITEFANAIKWKTIKEGSYMWRNPTSRRDVVTRPIEENLEWLENQIGVEVLKMFTFEPEA